MRITTLRIVLLLVGLASTGCTAAQLGDASSFTDGASVGADFLRQVLAAILV